MKTSLSADTSSRLSIFKRIPSTLLLRSCHPSLTAVGWMSKVPTGSPTLRSWLAASSWPRAFNS